MVMSLFQHLPNFHNEEVVRLAKKLYGVSCIAKQLPSERDQNFLLTSETGDRFVFKIANSLEQLPFLEAQNAAITHLQSSVSFCPRVISAQSGKQIEQAVLGGTSHFVRLVTYIPGKPMASVKRTSTLLFDLGKKLGEVTRALSSFDHPAFHREFHWNMVNATKIVRQYEELVTPPSLRKQVVKCADDFENAVGLRIDKLPRSVIHGDANDYNVIVEDQRVVGLIDFGDMIHSFTAGELAIALAYVVLDQCDPLTCAKEVVAGYISECSLNEDELNVIWWLMLMRLCMSVCLAAHQQKQSPANTYLDISQQSIRDSLPQLLEIDPRQATDLFRQNSAAG
jgi:Ser/Thr protein kinase RdoA (MazF antagonist)